MDNTDPTVMQVDADLDVTAEVTAPTMIIGDEDRCCIKVTEDNRMLITLPTDGKANGDTGLAQEYDMRSIIESIQELNRRTATFNCNVSFNSALDAYDVSTVSNDIFACDQDRDGLPAAQLGEVNLPAKDYVVKINVNHQTIGNYVSVEPRWDSNGNAVYSDTGAYDNGIPLRLSLNEVNRAELSNDYIEKIQNYFNGWDTFKGSFSCDGFAAIETLSHIELIDNDNKTVTFRALTTFGPRYWRYTSPSELYTTTEYANNITAISIGSESEFSLSDSLQSPITKMMLFKAINYTEYETNIPSSIPTSDVAYTVQYIGTFAQKDGLTSINLTHFDASNVTAMVRTFWEDCNVTHITFPVDFDTSKVKSMESMFWGCNALKSLKFPESFNTSSVISFKNFLSECYDLLELWLPDTFNTRNAKNMEGMFYNMFSLEILRLPRDFSFEKTETVRLWFYKRFATDEVTMGYKDKLTTLIIDNPELTLNSTLINIVDIIYRMLIGRQKVNSTEQQCDSLRQIYCYRPFVDSLRTAYETHGNSFGLNINSWTLATGSTVSDYITAGNWEDSLPRLLTKP